MNRQRSGFGLYAAFMVIIVLAMFYITGKISAGSSPSQQKFETAVKDGKVTSAQIVQNKEVPTGSVVVREQGGDSYTVNVTDVNAAISLLEDWINGLPRKILGYKNPEELFELELDLIYAR